ncbi:MAG TPA: hypothetical protein VMD77_03885 [Candidatus Baltobacteraceae bacterium]|nr:hypothetical protein [Candidatus Baltobacteraceae bacterium]
MPREIERALGGFVRAWSYLVALAGFLVVIPLSLWFAWNHRLAGVDALYSVIGTVFCASWAFATVSMLQVHRAIRRLGLSGEEAKMLFSGSRPTDPDELIAWKWGWRFMYGIIAGLICMLAISAISLLTGK